MQAIKKPKESLVSKDRLLKILRQEVEETFGRRIMTSRDCILLCEEIFVKTGYKLNSNTLRRFFGLVKAEYPCSTATLNILTAYCGYQSLDELTNVHPKVLDNTVIQEEDWSILYYFINLFKETPVKNQNDETFLIFVNHTIHFLQKKPEIAEKFQRSIVKTVNGQRFYFEQSINFDKLNSFYGAGLRYYINEKKTPEGKLFGYSLLCVRDWLIADNDALKKHFEYMKQEGFASNMQPLLYGNYFSAQLLHADVFEQSTEQTLIEAYKVHAGIKASEETYDLFNSFEYPFSIFLLLTQHYEEALYYINYAFANYPNNNHYLYDRCYQKMLLIKALALSKIDTVSISKADAHAEAQKIFQSLHPSEFHLLSKKLDTILYLLLGNNLNKSSYKQKKQFMELINDTGFKRLQYLWSN